MARRKPAARLVVDNGIPREFMDARPRLKDWATQEEIDALAGTEEAWVRLSVECKSRQREAMTAWGAERGLTFPEVLREIRKERSARYGAPEDVKEA